MKKRRVYHMLSLLQEEELKRFHAFLVSPVFNKKKSLQRFLELWMERVIPAEGEVEAEEFLEGSGFKLSRLDKMCSQLLSECLEFIALLEYEAAEHVRMELMAEGLAHREAPEAEQNRHAERHSKWLGSQHESATKEMQLLLHSWRLAEAKARRRQTQQLWKEDFRDLHELLDAYYFLQKLKLAAASANARHLFRHDEEPATNFLTFIRTSVEIGRLKPLTQAYYHTVEMLTGEEDSSEPFLALMVLLEAYGADFDVDEARELYHYALNFCIRKSNQGEEVYKGYIARLYRDLLAKGLLLINGRLPAQTMKNIVVIHCRLGELDWVEGFIASYRDLMPEETDPMTITYNEAVLAFFRQDYALAISLLKEVVSHLKDDIFFEVDARIYLWKSYFEHYEALNLDEVDEMEKMYDAFRIFIDRNKKLSEVHKVQYRNFIREFKRLLSLRLQEPIPQDRLEAFRTEVTGAEHTIGKEWFLEKVEELTTRASSPE